MSAQTAAAKSRTIPVTFSGSPNRERWSREARCNHADGNGHHVSTVAERNLEQEALILKMMGLVKRIALELREHLPANVEVDDLVSAGTLGLMDAVRRFQADKQVKFETYARYRIRGAMLDSLRGEDQASRDMRRRNKEAELTFQKLAVKLGRTPTDGEMADAFSVSLDEWYGTVSKLQSMGVEWLRPTRMGEAYPSDEENLPDKHTESQFDLCYRREQRDLLDRALEQVSERERRILSLYYEQDFSMKQIAEDLGVDESRISQIHATLLGRLKKNVQSMMRGSSVRATVPVEQAA